MSVCAPVRPVKFLFNINVILIVFVLFNVGVPDVSLTLKGQGSKASGQGATSLLQNIQGWTGVKGHAEGQTAERTSRSDWSRAVETRPSGCPLTDRAAGRL